MPSGAVLEGRGRPLQPKSAGLPGITRQRVGLPLKIFRLNSLLLLAGEFAIGMLKDGIYIVYWNSYAVFNDNRQLRIPLPLTKRQMMLANDVGLGRCTC